MSVLDRSALDESPLADLHTIASELSIDGYRRLRRADLIDAILGIEPGAATTADSEESEEDASPRRRRARRGGRGRTAEADDDDGAEPEADAESPAEPKPRRRARRTDAEDGKSDKSAEKAPRSSGRGAKPAERAAKSEERAPRAQEDQVAEGVVELLANGSGFLRVAPPDTSDEDVYISAAQVKRCELVSGDKISGPRRAPRRSERFPSLIRIDTINGRPADEVSEGARFEDLPATFPSEGLGLEVGNATIDAITAVAPFGKGSRVTIAGPAWAGKSEIVRALAAALAAVETVELLVVLAGIRPEEISEWARGSGELAGSVSFGASADAQSLVVERVIEQARRIAARGADAVVLIDTLDGLQPAAARKALAAARKIVDGGSLTVIATAAEPFGGETTVVALDPSLAVAGSFPALDPVLSRTARADLLVGDKRAKALATARSKAAAK
jgi:transcription termination factor Rho